MTELHRVECSVISRRTRLRITSYPFNQSQATKNELVNSMVQKLLVFAFLQTMTVFAFADESVTKDHATVHVVFVVPYETPDASGMNGSRAIVGDLALPIAAINPISISIDGEFVGHSMTGSTNVKPVFVLPHGKHKFEFSSDAFKPAKIELTVIGTGSKQYLIVKLLPVSEVTGKAKPNGDSVEKAVPPKG